VWGEPKTALILSALLAGPGPRGGAAALAFCYGRHPVDAGLLGRGAGRAAQVLLEVSAPVDDLWCRLPGSEFQVVKGGIAQHHQRRLAALRDAAAAASAAAAAALASGLGGRRGSGGGLAWAGAEAAAVGEQQEQAASLGPEDAGSPFSLGLAVASLSLWRGGSCDSWGGGGGCAASAPAPASSVCPSEASAAPASSLTPSTPASSTPTYKHAAAAASAALGGKPRRESDSSGFSAFAGSARTASDAEASPFAALCDAAAAVDEFWDEAEMVILPCRPGF
jgi:hypothetical protein